VTALLATTLAASAAGAVLATVRWLRVAQREHYLSGSVARFVGRWWGRDWVHIAAAAGALGSVVAEGFQGGIGILGAVVVGSGPLGLGVRGRSGRLRWSRRLGTIATIVAAEYGAAVASASLLGGLRLAATVAAAGAIGSPVVVEIALLVDRPLEWGVARRFVRRAAQRLHRIGPVVVGITGSYGKTSTKSYAGHLLAGTFRVVASPRSFNNRAGLARAVNEHLVPGTEIFIAEMGAYGAGEIAEMVSWLAPSVAAITAIGPVHLERFGSLERIVAAKSEILAHAECAVLNVDDERLVRLARELEDAGRRVLRCSAVDRRADVALIQGARGATLHVAGSVVGGVTLDPGRPIALTNVACAAGIAVALGVPLRDVADRLHSLPIVEHRLEVATSPRGVVVLDDTFNANPAGTQLALEALRANGLPGARVVVVTPGMVELGPLQRAANATFAGEVADVATDLVVVGSTNRRALLGGVAAARGDRRAGSRGLRVTTVPSRAAAVAWVRQELRAGDVVLYENDLPDQYP
jgi:UDP-N-acetylmuramoyl-tripeptide--D-alanyl-D-alanine ligase